MVRINPPRYEVIVKLFLSLIMALTSAYGATALAKGTIIYAGGSWAAIDRGDVCVAAGRSALIAARGKVQGTAGFAFARDRKRWGEFHAHLSHMPRPGSSVILSVGGQPFLLALRGDWAWSRGPLQEQAIIAAARSSAGMRIEGRDVAGRRFADPYALDGAPTAIDAAAARCAGKTG
jgi:hypothetical protein